MAFLMLCFFLLLLLQALGCLLFKMMFYTDPFDGKLGILNARYRIPDNSVYSSRLHDLISKQPIHIFRPLCS